MFYPGEAEKMPCPLSRTFAQAQSTCRGDACPVWRWVPLQAADPRFVKAISARQSEAGKGHKEAVAYVMANREALGLPTAPERGYCGLGGTP